MKTLERPGRGRPKKASAMEVLAVRMPPEILKEIDDYVELLQTELPGIAVSRADAVRQLVLEGLQAKTSSKKANNPK